MDYGNYDTWSLPANLLPDEEVSPEWMSRADNTWQLAATTMVCLQSVPGLVILYGSMVKKKWAVNSAFMAFYAFAVVLVCWVMWAHRMAFGTPMGPILNRPEPALDQAYLLGRYGKNGTVPMVDYVFYQFAFAAITVVLLAGSLLGRMNFYAWMLFVPLWLTFSYTVGACTIWGGGFLENDVIDYAGGFVIHLSSGVAGFVAAYWVGPRHSHDRQHFPPNNIIHMLGGAGFVWLGWTGFNGGSPFKAGFTTSVAILNTHLCTAMSLLVWLSLDMIYYQKSSVIGAVQGMITGLVCITPGAGIVEPWAAGIMGIMSGSIPWYTMMVLHRKLAFLQSVDDTLGVFHTHAVAGLLGGVLSGFFAKPNLLRLMYGQHTHYGPGLLYGLLPGGDLHRSSVQFLNQFKGAAFIAVWNIVVTSFICIVIGRFVRLRMNEEDLEVGDDAVHGEEAYALWGDGDKVPTNIKRPRLPSFCGGRR